MPSIAEAVTRASKAKRLVGSYAGDGMDLSRHVGLIRKAHGASEPRQIRRARRLRRSKKSLNARDSFHRFRGVPKYLNRFAPYASLAETVSSLQSAQKTLFAAIALEEVQDQVEASAVERGSRRHRIDERRFQSSRNTESIVRIADAPNQTFRPRFAKRLEGFAYSDDVGGVRP